MNYSHRFFLYGPVGLFAILMLAVTGYWWVASGAVSRRLDAMNGHEIAPGIHLAFAVKTMSGFPFRVDGELDGLRIAIDTSHGPAQWTAEHFAFHSLTYGRSQFIFEAAGRQHLEWHRDNGQLRSYDFLPGSLRASAVLDATKPIRFDLDLLNAASADISASEVQIHMRENPTIDGLDLFVIASDVRFAANEEPAFGPNMKHFAVNAMVSPGSSFARFLSGHGDWRTGANDWHARHGGLLVKTIELNWGALNATGKGALAVDDLHRPIGSLQFTLDDWQRFAQKSAASGQAAIAEDGLAGALSDDLSTGRQDSSKPLAVTLSFKDGMAYIGMMPADFLAPLY